MVFEIRKKIKQTFDSVANGNKAVDYRGSQEEIIQQIIAKIPKNI